MHLRIQRGSATPISRQIDAQIRALILSGGLEVDAQLPSVRQLARELAVNVNTIVRIYERLAADGLVALRHGEGTFVTYRRKQVTASALAEHQRELKQDLEALVRRGLMLGVSPDDLPQLLSQALASVLHEETPRKSTSSARQVNS